jgi:hypothetical protein
LQEPPTMHTTSKGKHNECTRATRPSNNEKIQPKHKGSRKEVRALVALREGLGFAVQVGSRLRLPRETEREQCVRKTPLSLTLSGSKLGRSVVWSAMERSSGSYDTRPRVLWFVVAQASTSTQSMQARPSRSHTRHEPGSQAATTHK